AGQRPVAAVRVDSASKTSRRSRKSPTASAPTKFGNLPPCSKVPTPNQEGPRLPWATIARENDAKKQSSGHAGKTNGLASSSLTPVRFRECPGARRQSSRLLNRPSKR